jgi:hypothetical protein
METLARQVEPEVTHSFKVSILSVLAGLQVMVAIPLLGEMFQQYSDKPQPGETGTWKVSVSCP